MSGRYRRLIVLTQYLANHPLDQVSLTELSQQLGVAKSTLSEDLVLVKDTLEHHN
ncbi:MAG: pur operon repressor, partial [Sulfobacillus sp.]